MRNLRANERSERAIATLAMRQHGVVSTAQLGALGFDKFAVHRRVRAGRLHPVHRGVYAVGRSTTDAKGRWRAGTLAIPESWLSHRTGGALLGVRPYAGTTEVTVLGPGGRRARRDLVVHRVTRMHPDDVTTVDGIPVTTFARTALDLAATLRRGLSRVLIRGEELELFDRRKIDAAIARAPRHRGIAPLRAAMAALHPDSTLTDSDLEIAMLELCRAHGLPAPSVNRTLEERKVDFHWPEHGLVVETDGWATHRTRHAFRNDRRCDRVLLLGGYRVLRFTYDEVEFEADMVADHLGRALLGA